MERIEPAALELIFSSDTTDAIDIFVDYITEIHDTEPEFIEVLVKGNDVVFIFEGPDFDSVKYDDDKDEDDYQDSETMVIGVYFKPGKDGADIKWIKNRS